MDDNLIKCEVKLSKIFFPKYVQSVESGEYSIFVSDITKMLEGLIDTKSIKLKGNVCKLEYGTVYRVTCKLSDHHEIYGDTYEILYMSKKIDISSKDKQKEFLSNVMNENLVDKLFDMYDDVITLLDNRDIESLIKVKGIKQATALRLIDEYEDAKDYSVIYTELGKLGLTHTFIKKITEFYKSPDIALEVIKNNPYDLVRVDGIGFKKADEVAIMMGLGLYDCRRIKGFLLYTLYERGEEGKSFLYYSELMKELYDTLGFVPEEVIIKTAQSMMEYNDVVVLDNGNKIALSRYYNLEENIKNELLRLLNEDDDCSDQIDNNDGIIEDLFDVIRYEYKPKSFNIPDWKDIISKVENLQGFSFTEEQYNAIELSLHNNIIAITGLAGAGKTATANGICKLFDNYNIVAVALSGKASVRITEATGLYASTIHKALGYCYGEFEYNKYNKLHADIILVDEATMINGSLFLSLLEAIPTGAKVIIMGDVQQLTPIGNCQIFKDILDSEMIPTVKLTKPHRQALLSGIIPTSINVAKQEQIFKSDFEGNSILGELQDMELDIYKSKADLSENIIGHFFKELDKVKDIMEVQIVVPMRTRGDISCYNLNTKIQQLYNPIKSSDINFIEIPVDKKKDEDAKTYRITLGDKVINTKNNYRSVNADGDLIPVFNGNIGIVKEIDDYGNCTVDFVGIGEVVLNKTESKSLELAYALTVHKVQGSGFNSAIVGIDSSSYIMNNSELLYTALTRAKKYCVLVARTSAVRSSIEKKEVNKKQTFLKDLLELQENTSQDASRAS